jgi:hypothetical protein
MTVMARVVEQRAMQYRRTFRASIFTSFLTPVLFTSTDPARPPRRSAD